MDTTLRLMYTRSCLSRPTHYRMTGRPFLRHWWTLLQPADIFQGHLLAQHHQSKRGGFKELKRRFEFIFIDPLFLQDSKISLSDFGRPGHSARNSVRVRSPPHLFSSIQLRSTGRTPVQNSGSTRRCRVADTHSSRTGPEITRAVSPTSIAFQQRGFYRNNLRFSLWLIFFLGIDAIESKRYPIRLHSTPRERPPRVWKKIKFQIVNLAHSNHSF